jgi:hypothetical protein
MRRDPVVCFLDIKNAKKSVTPSRKGTASQRRKHLAKPQRTQRSPASSFRANEMRPGIQGNDHKLSNTVIAWLPLRHSGRMK